MEDQDINTSENQNPIGRLGEHGLNGGPGRPKGQKNKYSTIKQDMLEVWAEEGGKEKFRELFRGSQKQYLKALDKIIALLPREPVEVEPEDDQGPQIIRICIVKDYGDPNEKARLEADIKRITTKVEEKGEGNG